MTTNQCTHGQLARSCEICELMAENLALKSQLEAMAKALEAAKSMMGFMEIERHAFDLDNEYRRYVEFKKTFEAAYRNTKEQPAKE